MKHPLQLLAVLLVIAGCDTGVGPSVATIVIDCPVVTFIGSGQTTACRATATASDGATLDVTKSALWSSSEPAVATVSSSGLVTAVAPGTTTITASVAKVSATQTIVVTFPPPAS